MTSENDLPSWSEGDLTREERYWEKGLVESREMLERQNKVLETKRETLTRFMQYHFIFIGFVFSIAKLGASGDVRILPWEIFSACIPSLIGIVISAQAHRSLGTYSIGFNALLFDRVREQANSYSDALMRLTSHYQGIVDENRVRIDEHDKYRFGNLLLLFLAFGVLLGSIIY